MPAVEPPRDSAELRRDVAKELRLWGLALICAIAGALVVWRTGSYWTGAAVAAGVLLLGAPVLRALNRRAIAGQDQAGREEIDRG